MDLSSPLRRRVLIGSVIVALVAGGFLVVALFRALRTTPCDGVRFRSSASPPGSESKSTPPPIGEGGVVRSLRAAFRGGSPAVFCDDFPDPFVLRVGHTYYAFSTNTLGGHVPVLTSGGLFGGGSRHDALPNIASWAEGDTVWAPSVAHIGGSYVMYYAARPRGSERHCLSRATSSDPAGPYVDTSSAPMMCNDAIDPSPFFDAAGTPYLVWAHDVAPTAIVGAPLSADGLSLAGAPTTLLGADQAWEDGIVEGPSMFVRDGHYYLFYSGNAWQTARYAIGYAVCNAPLGPCTKAPGPWLASSDRAQGPGGEELFTDSGGNAWMALHAWVDGKVGYPGGARNLFVVKLDLVNGVPVPA